MLHVFVVSSRFIIDFMATVPFELFVPSDDGNGISFAQVVKALKCIRLLR